MPPISRNLLEKVRERSELQGLSGGEVFDRTGAEVDLQFVSFLYMLLYALIFDNRQAYRNAIAEEVSIEGFSDDARYPHSLTARLA